MVVTLIVLGRHRQARGWAPSPDVALLVIDDGRLLMTAPVTRVQERSNVTVLAQVASHEDWEPVERLHDGDVDTVFVVRLNGGPQPLNRTTESL